MNSPYSLDRVIICILLINLIRAVFWSHVRLSVWYQILNWSFQHRLATSPACLTAHHSNINRLSIVSSNPYVSSLRFSRDFIIAIYCRISLLQLYRQRHAVPPAFRRPEIHSDLEFCFNQFIWPYNYSSWTTDTANLFDTADLSSPIFLLTFYATT